MSAVSRIMHALLWVAVAVIGAGSLGFIAVSRGETISAAWLVIAALCTYFLAYRFYALFVAKKVLGINPARQTPAYRHNDGLDYVPTNKYVLFGHHFAAIAGAGLWSDLCSRPRWAICPEHSGSSWARSLPAAFKT